MSGSDAMHNGDARSQAEDYEVVVQPDGIGCEHAELLRKQLIDDGFYQDVVEVRKQNTRSDFAMGLSLGFGSAFALFLVAGFFMKHQDLVIENQGAELYILLGIFTVVALNVASEYVFRYLGEIV